MINCCISMYNSMRMLPIKALALSLKGLLPVRVCGCFDGLMGGWMVGWVMSYRGCVSGVGQFRGDPCFDRLQ